MPSTPTATQQLIEVRLGRPLRELVTEMTAEGKGWRLIAREIRRRTEISVSHETIRTWMTDEQGDAA